MAIPTIERPGLGVRVPMIRPSRAMTSVATADLWAEPRADSELVERSRARVVAVLRAALRDEPDASSAHRPAPVGSPLLCGRREGDWIEIPSGWVALADAVDPDDLPRRAPTADELVATAAAFLGTPYRWAGTSGGGIDCSPFVQQVYRLSGGGLDRDADQQAREGRAVSAARPGDLLFFGAERVTHVALATGKRHFIHAPQQGAVVERSALSAGRAPRAIRRYLPDVSPA